MQTNQKPQTTHKWTHRLTEMHKDIQTQKHKKYVNIIKEKQFQYK